MIVAVIVTVIVAVTEAGSVATALAAGKGVRSASVTGQRAPRHPTHHPILRLAPRPARRLRTRPSPPPTRNAPPRRHHTVLSRPRRLAGPMRR